MVEGRLTRRVTLAERNSLKPAPPPPPFGRSPSPAARGRKIDSRSRDAGASESCNKRRKFRLQISEGRRSADRRIVQYVRATHSRITTRTCCGRGGAPHSQTLPPECASGALASRRSAAVLAAQVNATAQPRPHFMRTGGCRCYPHHRTHPQRSTSRTGHSAGRVDAQAAREQFARLPAGTALAPLSGSHLESALHRAR